MKLHTEVAGVQRMRQACGVTLALLQPGMEAHLTMRGV